MRIFPPPYTEPRLQLAADMPEPRLENGDIVMALTLRWPDDDYQDVVGIMTGQVVVH